MTFGVFKTTFFYLNYGMKKITCLAGALLLLAACESTPPQQQTQTVVESAQPHTEPVKAAADSIRYDSYCNQRYHYCIDYPKDYLTPQGESGSEDGQAFKSADGANSLLAYRDLRDKMDPDVKFDIKTTYEEDLKDGNIKEVTYKKLGKDFYVISGYNKKDKVFYQKSMLSEGQLITCLLEYRKDDKELFNKISEHVFRSFK